MIFYSSFERFLAAFLGNTSVLHMKRLIAPNFAAYGTPLLPRSKFRRFRIRLLARRLVAAVAAGQSTAVRQVQFREHVQPVGSLYGLFDCAHGY